MPASQHTWNPGRVLVPLALLLLSNTALWPTDGHFMHGSGPVNQSMGGADTGACLDVTGSLAWNPACTILFEGKLLDANLEWFIPFRTLGSVVTPNAFGAGFPRQTMSGSTQSATDAALMPSFAFVRHASGSRNAYHFGLIGVAGFGVDYAQDSSFANAILTPQPPYGMGFGRIRSNYALMKIPLGISRQLTERFSVGFSAVTAMSMLRVTPAPFAAPVAADGSQFPQYLAAAKTSKAFGVGANVGVQYELRKNLRLGAAYHTPIRFQDFHWSAADAAGATHDLRFRLDMPALVTMGLGYTPAPGTTLALDARWIDYEGTRGFDGSGFRPDGSVAGFGWRNIWTVGGGVQQRVGSRTKIRAGYNFSQNPIPSALAFFNTPSPAIVQHHITAGFSRALGKELDMHFVYYHVFKNRQSGPFVGPSGPVAGSSVTSELAENSVSVGFSRRF